MARIKVCLNDACTDYKYIDDGRLIIQPRDKCDTTSISKDFQKQFKALIPKITETVYVSKNLIKGKVGDEVPF